jgi:hypothetical protein
VTWITKRRDKSHWHSWFAWRPVRVSALKGGGFHVSQWVWLERVERMREFHAIAYADYFEWHYRLVER